MKDKSDKPKYRIKVQTNCSKERVVEVNHPEYDYKVYVSPSPEKDKANYAVVDVLADYLGIPESTLVIKSGKRSKIKVVEILS